MPYALVLKVGNLQGAKQSAVDPIQLPPSGRLLVQVPETVVPVTVPVAEISSPSFTVTVTPVTVPLKEKELKSASSKTNA